MFRETFHSIAVNMTGIAFIGAAALLILSGINVLGTHIGLTAATMFWICCGFSLATSWMVALVDRSYGNGYIYGVVMAGGIIAFGMISESADLVRGGSIVAIASLLTMYGTYTFRRRRNHRRISNRLAGF